LLLELCVIRNFFVRNFFVRNFYFRNFFVRNFFVRNYFFRNFFGVPKNQRTESIFCRFLAIFGANLNFLEKRYNENFILNQAEEVVKKSEGHPILCQGPFNKVMAFWTYNFEFLATFETYKSFWLSSFIICLSSLAISFSSRPIPICVYIRLTRHGILKPREKSVRV